jgi:cytochrome o ubiquinol oxidase subunit II
MIAAFNGRDRQEKVDRSRHASEIGSDLNRGAGHESRKADSWKTLLLSDAAFHGSAVTRHRRTAPGHRAGARASLAAVVLAPTLASCQSGVLDPQGPIGAAQRTILINALAIMLAIVVPTIVATLGFSWWFRASNTRAQYRPDWAYSGRIELVVWSIPLLVIIFLGGIAWIGSHDLDPAKPLDGQAKPLKVQVVSLDWKWLFIYPDQGIASVNRLVVPVGTPIHFTLTSASVMNAFFIPQLGSMIYTMNGMTTQLHLQADREGVFHGLSSQFSGDGFPGMHFQVRAVGAEAFDSWVGDARNSTAALDRQSYVAFAKQSLNVAPTTYRAVDPHLFQEIVSQAIPAAPGPQIGKPTPAVSPRTGG